jgi:hypothetical protein
VAAKRVRESEDEPLLAVPKSPARSTPPEKVVQVLLGLLSRCIIDDRLVNGLDDGSVAFVFVSFSLKSEN